MEEINEKIRQAASAVDWGKTVSMGIMLSAASSAMSRRQGQVPSPSFVQPDASLALLRDSSGLTLVGGALLTPATPEQIGGVKVGPGLNVTEDGTLSL